MQNGISRRYLNDHGRYVGEPRRWRRPKFTFTDMFFNIGQRHPDLCFFQVIPRPYNVNTVIDPLPGAALNHGNRVLRPPDDEGRLHTRAAFRRDSYFVSRNNQEIDTRFTILMVNGEPEKA